MENEERLLIQAILENPFDDLPRLIIADWYEGNEQLKRAEFIRYQIANNASGNCICGARGPSHVCSTCVMFDVKNVSGTSAMVITRRGFIDEIRCTQSDFIGRHCGRCWATPGFLTDGAGGSREVCPACKGQIIEGGIAKRVGESWPVTKVVITDAVIHASLGNDTYYLGGLGSFPSKYWKALDNHRSRLDVSNALARVCVSYMRELANLPPLDGFTF